MWLLVGLGNPGSDYARNRHNVGFMAVDAIVRRHGFSGWRASKFSGELAEGSLGTERVLALKPMTYMNLSGQSVGELARFYKIAPDHIIVLHDELDLPPGRLRAKRGGGHGGHNGLRSIDAHCTPDYWRVRIGIGHPGDKARVHGHVLGNFAKDDESWLEKLLPALADAAPDLLRDPNAYVSKVTAATQPPKPPKPPKAPKPAAADPVSSPDQTPKEERHGL